MQASGHLQARPRGCSDRCARASGHVSLVLSCSRDLASSTALPRVAQAPPDVSADSELTSYLNVSLRECRALEGGRRLAPSGMRFSCLLAFAFGRACVKPPLLGLSGCGVCRLSYSQACGILVSCPGLNPCPLPWKQILNHWTAREVPSLISFYWGLLKPGHFLGKQGQTVKPCSLKLSSHQKADNIQITHQHAWCGYRYGGGYSRWTECGRDRSQGHSKQDWARKSF